MADIRRVGPDAFRVIGIVRSSMGAPVASAGVSVLDVTSGATVPTYSDELLSSLNASVFADRSGRFSFFLPTGRYRLAYTGNDSFNATENLDLHGTDHLPVRVRRSGVVVAMRRFLNFIAGSNVGLAVVDDPVNDQVNVTITSTIAGNGFAVPSATIDIGDSAVEGVAVSALRSDAQFAFPAPAAGYPVDVAAVEADGVSTKASRDDHRHAHGVGYLPDAHHTQAHALAGADHTAQDVALIPGVITDAQHGVRTLASAHAHSALSGVSADQHHARSHAILGASDHTGIQVLRASTGSVAAGGQVEVTVTWPTAWADTNYTVVVSLQETTSDVAGAGMRIRRIRNKNAADFTVIVQNENLITAVTGTLHVCGIHD